MTSLRLMIALMFYIVLLVVVAMLVMWLTYGWL